MSDPDLDELRAELDEFAQSEKKGGRPPREERIIAGFEEIQRFVDKNGRPPKHGEDGDIFERLYAVRLDRLRALDDCRTLLGPFDHQRLLTVAPPSSTQTELMDDDELLAELEGAAGSTDITKLKHVKTRAEIKVAEEIAQQTRCPDFEKFKPLIIKVQDELKSGVRNTREFKDDASIRLGEFFILSGKIAYVAEIGEEIRAPNGESDARLRVIYDNGTESNLLRRSLQRALFKDSQGNRGRRITDPSAGPLFSDLTDDDDIESGTIYVLRSMSEHPLVVSNRNILHKIGVTGGSVERRIANARLDPTFLMADVEIIATYELYNINRTKLENLIHRVFGSARLDVEIKDRFGQPIIPKEWFLAPLFVIDEAVGRIRDGTITGYIYDAKAAQLVQQ